ncbi:MAG: thioredoxin domain-containing protein [Hyphomicrobiales bacterium]|nr:MAG: thioredoxin domain-containing protein [Hyphomicrobiales bacterium]
MTENRLRHETSPYLLQHRDNPVHWYAWGPEAFAEAKRTGKPILLSVGYAACHWCHVMAHESFEDEATAAVMNALFVNVKVDREERPDVDQIYMSALHALGEQGGWPLTMFLTPEGEPVWGGTYFPPTPRYGRPGFTDILKEISRLFRDEPEKIASNQQAIMAHLKEVPRQAATQLPANILDRAAKGLLSIMDAVEGGPQGAPKFPNPALLELLWRAYARTGNTAHRDAVLLTLRHMAQGGIYDHLGGGYSRYSVDEVWLVPHFEKMLYDNAQLISLLTNAWLETGDPLFRERIEETVDWLEREMLDEGGAFAASLDADSEGEEGRFYIWTKEQIDALLPPDDAALFAAHYDVTADGNWAGNTVLTRRRRPERANDETEIRLAAIRARLLEARAERVRPGRDDKVLADWNALAIVALARAAKVFERDAWLDRAVSAYRFISESMLRDGRLGHSWCNGQLIYPGLSSDHAGMAAAALALHEATGEEAYLGEAKNWIAILHMHYRDEERGGYYLTAADAEDLIIRPRSAKDEATPNPNAVAAAALTRLWVLTGEDRYRDATDGVFQAFAADIPQNVFMMSALLNAFDLRLNAISAIVVANDHTDAEPLLAALRQTGNPSLIPFVTESTGGLPPSHPASGKVMIDNLPTLYVCRGMTCSAPVTDPASVAELLSNTQ